MNTEAPTYVLWVYVSASFTLKTIFEQKTEASSCASQISHFQETLGVYTDAGLLKYNVWPRGIYFRTADLLLMNQQGGNPATPCDHCDLQVWISIQVHAWCTTVLRAAGCRRWLSQSVVTVSAGVRRGEAAICCRRMILNLEQAAKLLACRLTARHMTSKLSRSSWSDRCVCVLGGYCCTNTVAEMINHRLQWCDRLDFASKLF